MKYLLISVFLLLGFGLFQLTADEKAALPADDAAWKEKLTPEQYRVLRKAGTERPHSSPLNQEKRKGTFVCAGCGSALFASESKYESGTGWPSFSQPITPEAVGTREDRSFSAYAPKYTARFAKAIWDMYSMTDRNPPACVIA